MKNEKSKKYAAPQICVGAVVNENGFASSTEAYGEGEGEAAGISKWNDYNEF